MLSFRDSSDQLYMQRVFMYHNEKWQIVTISMSLKTKDPRSGKDVMN